MISFLRGILFDVSYDEMIIEVGGVGYQVSVHPADAAMFSKGDAVFVYTYLSVREDGMQLFGFRTAEGLHLFKSLLSASGIGPKTALTISGATSLNDFVTAICTDDVSALVRLPGVGKKTAQRMLVELKDKLSHEKYPGVEAGVPAGIPGVLNDAREALQGLGFSPFEVEELLQEAIKETGPEAGSDHLVKHVLRRVGGGR